MDLGALLDDIANNEDTNLAGTDFDLDLGTGVTETLLETNPEVVSVEGKVALKEISTEHLELLDNLMVGSSFMEQILSEEEVGKEIAKEAIAAMGSSLVDIARLTSHPSRSNREIAEQILNKDSFASQLNTVREDIQIAAASIAGYLDEMSMFRKSVNDYLEKLSGLVGRECIIASREGNIDLIKNTFKRIGNVIYREGLDQGGEPVIIGYDKYENDRLYEKIQNVVRNVREDESGYRYELDRKSVRWTDLYTKVNGLDYEITGFDVSAKGLYDFSTGTMLDKLSRSVDVLTEFEDKVTQFLSKSTNKLEDYLEAVDLIKSYNDSLVSYEMSVDFFNRDNSMLESLVEYLEFLD